MKMFLITDSIDTYEGLRMAGVDGVVLHDDGEVLPAVKQAVAEPDIGVLLITRRLARLCHNFLAPYKMSAATPLIVEIPDRHTAGQGGDTIAGYIKEAMGLTL